MSFYKPNKPIYLSSPEIYLPELEITNEKFIKWIDSNIKPTLVEKRTGIQKRYWASKDQAVTDLALKACELLFSSKKIDKKNIKLLIFSTISSDFIVPPSAPLLQHKLGLDGCGAFDLSAACAGFVTSISMASSICESIGHDILVASSEIRSKFLNPKDFQTACLFGDGAASLIISQSKENADFQILCGQLFSDGSISDIISIPTGGSRTPHSSGVEPYPYLKMKGGAELFIKALDGMYQSSIETLDRMNMRLTDIDWVVPHQANLHMIKALADKLDFPMNKVIQTIKKYGNTSGASVGMALNELTKSYPIKKGDKVLLISAGGGGLAANSILEFLP